MSGEKYSIPFYRQRKTTDVQQKLNSLARTSNQRKFNLVLSKSGAILLLPQEPSMMMEDWYITYITDNLEVLIKDGWL